MPPDEASFCIALADSADWIEEVIAAWPGPIAHDYNRLRGLLKQDQLLASVWQLKDVAEVLIRFPACVMARDVLEHGSDADFQREVRRTLLGKPLSMGDWHRLADALASHIVNHAHDFLAAEVASLFRRTNGTRLGEATAFNALIGNLTTWRNESFGHGAFRADVTDFQRELGPLLKRLHQELGSHRDVWRGLVLERDDGTALIGATSIEPHLAGSDSAHRQTTEPLALARDDGRRLVLGPYIQMRRCTVCDCRDVFLFEWRRTSDRKGRDRYAFIDYRAGHTNVSTWSAEPLLDDEAERLGKARDAVSVGEGTVDDDYISNDVAAMLAERAMSERYKRPEYLRQRLDAFLRDNASGVWWLRAPGHTGKSTFVSGLDPRYLGDLKETPIGGDLGDATVVVFYIRREYQTSLAQFADGLMEQLKTVLNVRAGARPLPVLDLDATDPQRAMVDWLQAMEAASGGRHRLVICIDGLDELAPGDERGIADFIPAPASLPDGLFFVLTSRPLEDLPTTVAARLLDHLGEVEPVDVRLDDPEYRALLKAFFFERVSKRREREALDAASRHHDYDRLFDLALDRSDGRFLYLAYLADRLADETLGLDDLDQLPSADELFASVLDDIERMHKGSPIGDLYKRILLQLTAAERAFEEDRQRQPALAQETWHGLPLDLLSRRVEGGGRVSLKLAYVLYTLKPMLGSWKGGDGRHASFHLGVSGLSDAIDRRYSVELPAVHAQIVNALMDHLSVLDEQDDEAGDDLDAEQLWALRYATSHLQLSRGKTISARDAARLATQLWQQGSEAFGQKRMRDGIRWRTRSVALERSAGGRAGKARMANDAVVALVSRAEALQEVGDFRGAVQDLSAAIEVKVGQRGSSAHLPGGHGSDIAFLHARRGAIELTIGDQSAAREDLSRAIELWEALRGRSDGKLSSDEADQLGRAYTNRGVTYLAQGDATKALADHEHAVATLQQLQQRLGAEWTPNMAYGLAWAYQSRAGARKATGDLQGSKDDVELADGVHKSVNERFRQDWSQDSAAWLESSLANVGVALHERNLEGWDRAITLLERLREPLGEAWSPDLADLLASTYTSAAESRGGRGDYSRAFKEHGQAIEMYTSLRKSLAGQMPAAVLNRYAKAHVARARDLLAVGDARGVLKDLGRAVELNEELRQKSGPGWPPAYADDAATTLLKRGLALSEAEDHRGALNDFEHAVEILASLQTRMEDQWPQEYDESLQLGRELAAAEVRLVETIGSNVPATRRA